MADIFIHHPYYPPGVVVPNYKPNDSSVLLLAAGFASSLGFVVLGASNMAWRLNEKISPLRTPAFYWFIISGAIHCFFEGYFVFNHATIASDEGLFGQLWKEYALSDSRYLTSDGFLLCIESITTFVWGPLCFACAICIVADSPFRRPLQMIVSMAHLYGAALYFSTSFFELFTRGISHSRPEFLYFWVYYVGFNLPWIIVPLIMLSSDVSAIAKALRVIGNVESALDKHNQAAAAKSETESKKQK